MTSVFETPDVNDDEQEVLELIAGLREELSDSATAPLRWAATLRRMSFARAVQGSNSIEGFTASLDDVAAVAEGEPTLDADLDTQLAVAGVRDAMTYALQIAGDVDLTVDEGLLRSLPFMMLKHDLGTHPGRWRPGAMSVRDPDTSEIRYQAPPVDHLPELIRAMLERLAQDDSSVLVTAAMAHLNLVCIHPFSDGNGRMARCLQTLILAQDRLIAPSRRARWWLAGTGRPVFLSIEEFVGRNRDAYYAVLADVGGGAWHPERDARPWVRFCLRGHYLQAHTVLRRRRELEQLWNACVHMAQQHSLPERCAAGLMDSAYGLRLRRGTYKSTVEGAAGEEISDLTASRDLKAMVNRTLLEPIGERRGRYYVASIELKRLSREIRSERPEYPEVDPFEVVRERR